MDHNSGMGIRMKKWEGMGIANISKIPEPSQPTQDSFFRLLLPV